MGRDAGICVTSLCGALAACGAPAETDFRAPVSSTPGIATGGAGNGGTGTGGNGGAGGTTPSSGGAGVGGSAEGGAGGTGSGGSGETGGAGGLAGSGGAPPGPDELIDDMEDGDGQVKVSGGRDGYWYAFGDDTQGGYLQPEEGADFVMAYAEPARAMSTRAARLLGGNFEDWGAALGFDFTAESGPYDAGSFTGLRFFARSTQGPLEIMVALPDRISTPQGGVCDQGGQGQTIECYDHPFTHVAITGEWEEYTVAFDALDRGPASLPPFDASAVFSVQFGTPPGGTFDIWIDDVAFTR
jgi:hypothetical protein